MQTQGGLSLLIIRTNEHNNRKHETPFIAQHRLSRAQTLSWNQLLVMASSLTSTKNLERSSNSLRARACSASLSARFVAQKMPHLALTLWPSLSITSHMFLHGDAGPQCVVAVANALRQSNHGLHDDDSMSSSMRTSSNAYVLNAYVLNDVSSQRVYKQSLW